MVEVLFFGIMASFIFFGVLHAVIKSAVSSGIDSSKEIPLLINEIRDIHKQIRTEVKEKKQNHIIDKKA
ncbi:MAG: hypothetical protein ACE3JQ_03020 [Paenisporosarcina sp.]